METEEDVKANLIVGILDLLGRKGIKFFSMLDMYNEYKKLSVEKLNEIYENLKKIS